MDHLAILSKEGKFLDKILSGEKSIESRWYKFKKTPYETIAAGDVIYFKESGESVTAKSQVSGVLFFDQLNEEKITKAEPYMENCPQEYFVEGSFYQPALLWMLEKYAGKHSASSHDSSQKIL